MEGIMFPFVCMIQLCGKSIVKPLKYLFESPLIVGIFPENWEKDWH